jgi:hypothetical protein
MDALSAARLCFPASYADARARFHDACRGAAVEVDAYANPRSGPDREALATDVAWVGPRDARAVLVVVSATHGVEGFPGSGAQVDWLRGARPAVLPEGVAALLVHAINPHGFAWLRRVTEEGVDLNRNFVDFASPLPQNPGYDRLADALVPAALDDATLAGADARIDAYRAEHGEDCLMVARSAGQYRHPGGMFYGGTEPTWSRRTLERIASDFELHRRELVAVVDFHTGLGPFGYGEPICAHTLGTANVARAAKWYGRSVTQPALGTSSSVEKTGLAEYGWERLLGERVTFIALEYGTYPPQSGLRVLRADHWLHNAGALEWSDPTTRRIKREIRLHFAPETLDWREMVLLRSRQILRQALSALGGEPELAPERNARETREASP